MEGDLSNEVGLTKENTGKDMKKKPIKIYSILKKTQKLFFH